MLKKRCILSVCFCSVLLLSCSSYIGDRHSKTALKKETIDCQRLLSKESSLRDFFSCENLNQINQFIDPEIGLTVLYANGCYPQYEKLDSLSSDIDSYDLPDWLLDEIFQSLNFKSTNVTTLQHTDSPIFNGEEILQYGAFIDESDGRDVMCRAIQHLIRTVSMEDGDIGYLNKLKKDFLYYKHLENKSIRLILTEKTEKQGECGTRIFHFTEKQNRLYLYLLDFYSFDVSV